MLAITICDRKKTPRLKGGVLGYSSEEGHCSVGDGASHPTSRWVVGSAWEWGGEGELVPRLVILSIARHLLITKTVAFTNSSLLAGAELPAISSMGCLSTW